MVLRVKKTKRYEEQKPEQVAAYLKQTEGIPVERIAYVDESGIDRFLYREYGWAQRGEEVIGVISGKKYKRTGIVAAKLGKEIIEPLQYEGTMDSVLFEKWYETRLLPKLPAGTVIVMDNASFHRKSKLTEISERMGHRLIFLSPYSPELNPIEHYWSWLKRQLRKILHLHDSFDDALRYCLQVG
jgi:transposase